MHAQRLCVCQFSLCHCSYILCFLGLHVSNSFFEIISDKFDVQLCDLKKHSRRLKHLLRWLWQLSIGRRLV